MCSRQLNRNPWLGVLAAGLALMTSCSQGHAPAAGPTQSANSATGAPRATAAGTLVTASVTPAMVTATFSQPPASLMFSSTSVGVAAVLGQEAGDLLGGCCRATATGGIARTTDGGVHWSEVWSVAGASIGWVGPAGNLLKGIGSVFPVGPSITSTANGQPVVVTSADGGATWWAAPAQTPADLPAWQNVTFAFGSAGLGFGVADPNVGSAESSLLSGVLRTVDGGLTWRLVTLPGGAQPSGGIAVLGSTRVLVTATGGPGSEIYASDDDGLTWSAVPGTEEPFRLWSLSFVDASHGFAGGGGLAKYSLKPDRALLATSDGGHTWKVRYESTTQSTNGFTRVLFRTPLEGAAETGGCTNGANGPCGGDIYVSRDGGATWHDTGQPSYVMTTVGPSTIWAVEPYSSILRRSMDRGTSWTSVPFPLPESPPVPAAGPQYFALALTGGPRALLLSTGTGRILSTDGGRTWSPFAPPIVSGTVGFDAAPAVDPPLVFEGSSLPNQLRVSRDDGNTWAVTTLPAPAPLTQLLADGGMGYAVAGLALPTLSSPMEGSVMSVTVDARGKTDLHFLTSPGLSTFAMAVSGSTMAAVGTTTNIGTGIPPLLSVSSPELRVSTDAGRSWQSRALPSSVVGCGASPSLAGSTLWLACTPPGDRVFTQSYAVAVSRDLGRTWQVFALPGVGVVGLVATGQASAVVLLADGSLARTDDGGRIWQGFLPAAHTIP